MARSLAERGIATLRFDLPGTGDSSGSALDHKLISAWIRSVQDAVAELKTATGVQEVSIFGVRLGAMLALAACGGTQVENLILWGASLTGRTLLRELRAFRNLEVAEFAEGEAAPPQPIDGLEVAGFLLSRQTETDLEAFTVADLPPMPNQKVLLLTRDSFPHDNRLIQSLEKAGCRLTLKEGPGYQDMLAAPHEPLPFSPATAKTIIRIFEAEDGGAGSHGTRPLTKSSVLGALAGWETAWSKPCFRSPIRGESLFSVTAHSADCSTSPEWGLLFMNAGGVRHIGPNRMWVEAARRWAARGIPSVRVDFQRTGESDGEEPASIASLHGNDLVEQLNLVMNAMRAQLGCRKFIAVGLCSGAFAAFQSVIQDPAIRTALLLNPRLFFWDPEIEPRRLAKRVGSGCADLGYWRRLVRGAYSAGAYQASRSRYAE